MIGVEGLAVREGLAIELGVELRGVEIGPHAEHLNRAGLRGRQHDGAGRRREDGVVVGDERLKGGRDAGAQRVGQTSGGQGDLGSADLLGIGGVDDGALMPGEGADAVAGPEEGEVSSDNAVEQGGELGLNTSLSIGFHIFGGGCVEGRSPHHDAGVRIHVDVGHGF